MFRRDSLAFSTASSTSCPLMARLFQSWALTMGMEALRPADQVLRRPTSMPPPVSDFPEEEEEEEGAGVVEEDESPLPGSLNAPMSKSMYMTCLLMVL